MHPRRSTAAAVAALIASAAVLVPPLIGSASASATTPGLPGTPQPPTALFTEDFSAQDATAAAIDIVNYQGTPGTSYAPGVSGASSERYTVDPGWAGSDGRCNGLVVRQTTPQPSFWPSGCDFNAMKNLVASIGLFQGMTPSAAAQNQALGEYTANIPTLGSMIQTATPIPALPGHFYSVSAIFGATNCQTGNPTTNANPHLDFALLIDGTPNTLATHLDPCFATDHRQFGSGPFGPTFVAQLRTPAIRIPTSGSPTVGLRLQNTQTTGAGNDAAFDLPQILDVTPQLDKSFTPATITAGQTSTLTYVVTNTNELGAKQGWSFDDTLPAGLTAVGNNSTTCNGGTVSAPPDAASVAVTGNLLVGQSSCSVSVTVRAGAVGTYTNGPDNFSGPDGLSGLNPPADATLTAVQPGSLVVTKSSSTTAIDHVGQIVGYKFLVENRSPQPITGLALTDAQTPPATQAALGPIRCAVTALAPRASTTCEADYTVTQADLDHGSVGDVATASGTGPGGPVTSLPSALTITTPQPALSIVKSSTTTRATAVGQVIPYTFAVSNTGNVPLDGVQVQDTQTPPATGANMTAVTCPQATLAPGASETCTGSYTVTQADLASGTIADQAAATASGPDGAPVTSQPSALAIPSVMPSGLAVVKTSQTTTLTASGQVIPYTFTVTNTSAATIHNIGIADTQAAPALPANMGPITCLATTLAAGAETTCTGSYTATTADLSNGAVADTATANGLDPANNPVVSAPSTLSIGVPVATLTIVKSSTTHSVSNPGQLIPYSFVVTNTGNVPVTSLSVSDTQVAPAVQGNLSAVTCPQTTLAVGASTTCTATYTVAQTDLDAGTINDVAVANGLDPANNPVSSPQSSLIIPAATAPLTVVKATTTDRITSAGQVVPLSFTITDQSDVPYTDPQIADVVAPPATQANLSSIVCPAVVPALRSVTCTGAYTVTQADIENGSLADTAHATGVDPAGRTVTTADSSLVLPATSEPALSIVKSSPITTVTAAGQPVPYLFTVTNTGNRILTAVSVADTVSAPSDPAGLSAIVCPATTLAPGERTACTATYTATQADVDHGSIADSAIASATGPDGPVASPPSDLTIAAQRSPALVVTKTTPVTSVSAVGEVIPFTITVRNSGNTTVSGIAVVDTVTAPSDPAALGPVTCSTTVLAPGDSEQCTAQYTVTQADLDKGAVADSASASGSGPAGDAVASPPATLSVPAVQTPTLTIAKATTTTSAAAVGDTIPYTFTVANTGNVTISAVGVTDTVTAPSEQTALSAVTCTTTTLAPGDSTQCAAAYTVTQADLDHGSLSDTATAGGTVPGGGAVTSAPSALTVPALQQPALTMVKSASPDDPASFVAGQEITYTYTVTNTGNLTLSDPAIDETRFTGTGPAPAPTCAPGPLAPGGQLVCTATYTLTAADAGAAQLTNTADATATDPAGDGVASADSSVTIPLPAAPGISLSKSATPANAAAAGDAIAYRYTITNTGNVALENVGVTETSFTGAGSGPVPVCPAAVLAPGASMVCTAPYTVVQQDIDRGEAIGNTATASGTPPGAQSPTTSTPAEASVTVTQSPAATLKKTVSATAGASVGDQVTYHYLVTNTGNTTLTALDVPEARAGFTGTGALPVPVCPTTSLAPGASVTCTAVYTITAQDVEAGTLRNTTSATLLSGTESPAPETTSPSTAELPLTSGGTTAPPPTETAAPAPASTSTSGPQGASLPDTGLRISIWAALAGAILIIGGGMLVGARRRGLRRRRL